MTFTPRTYPIPDHISPEAQAVLKTPHDVDYANLSLQSASEWATWRDKADASFRKNLSTFIAAMPITVERQTIADVPTYVVTPRNLSPDHSDAVMLHYHGGGYVLLGGDLCVVEAARLAVTSGLRVISVDYRMAPEHPCPAALDDALTVYKATLDHYGPEHSVVQGTSAGGGLLAAMIIAARESGLPLPAAAAFNTPWMDLTGAGDSYHTHEGLDPVLPRWEGGLKGMAEIYAGDIPLNDPRLSPIYSDYSGDFPPSVLIAGTRDLFLSNTVRLHRALRDGGHTAELHVYEAGWHGLGFTPEAQNAAAEMSAFLTRYL